MLWIILSILAAAVVAIIGYFIFFSKDNGKSTLKPENTTYAPIKLIGNISDPTGIKNGDYKEVSNSKFFGSNTNSWNISIKFNLENFNNSLQSIMVR